LPPSSNPTTYQTIPLALIDVPHPTNARLASDPHAVRRLRDQIATSGLINPITVRPHGTRYQLIAGLNRIQAFRLLQRDTIPAHVVHADDAQASTMRLTENLTRTNLSPVEEAAQLADLVDADPGGVDAVAATIGRTVPWVLDRLEILAWDPDLQQAVHARKISTAAAKRLARIPDPDTRRRYVHQAAVHGISARTANLWLQDATSLSETQTVAPENSIISPSSQQPPELRVACFACGERHNIQTMHPVRLCPNCLTAIQESLLHAADNRQS
jgi:ParB/RepB/Spo0J family partition protein